mgnify:CR=1 FL=1
MHAEFVLVDNGVLPLCMALGAPREARMNAAPGSVCFRLGSLPVHQKGADDEPKPDNQCDEDGSERQVASSSRRDLLRPVTLASSWGSGHPSPLQAPKTRKMPWETVRKFLPKSKCNTRSL